MRDALIVKLCDAVEKCFTLANKWFGVRKINADVRMESSLRMNRRGGRRKS